MVQQRNWNQVTSEFKYVKKKTRMSERRAAAFSVKRGNEGSVHGSLWLHNQLAPRCKPLVDGFCPLHFDIDSLQIYLSELLVHWSQRLVFFNSESRNVHTRAYKLIHFEPYSSAFHISSSGLFPTEFLWKYGSYRQSVGLLGWVISRVARPLPTQDNTITEETWTHINASSGTRTRDSRVWEGEGILRLRPRGQYARILQME
jgi:hypothetical protein